jgi:hypothetical protein
MNIELSIAKLGYNTACTKAKHRKSYSSYTNNTVYKI